MDAPSELSIDALNTATPNLADESTSADGPPISSGLDMERWLTTLENFYIRKTFYPGG